MKGTPKRWMKYRFAYENNTSDTHVYLDFLIDVPFLDTGITRSREAYVIPDD